MYSQIHITCRKMYVSSTKTCLDTSISSNMGVSSAEQAHQFIITSPEPVYSVLSKPCPYVHLVQIMFVNF